MNRGKSITPLPHILDISRTDRLHTLSPTSSVSAILCRQSLFCCLICSTIICWNRGAEDHILRIELVQRRYYKYRNPIALCEYVEAVLEGHKNEKYFLFIDEVQLTTKVKDNENGGIEVTIYDMLNELKAYKNLDVYVTGSNSRGLSKNIATEFRGRATQIHVFLLSFAEYYSYIGGDERKALDNYMLFGGMPRLLALDDEKDKKDYLSSLHR